MTHHHHGLTLCNLGKFSGGHTLGSFRPFGGKSVRGLGKGSTQHPLYFLRTHSRARIFPYDGLSMQLTTYAKHIVS